MESRKYRSKKQAPCDACRRRRIGCIRREGDRACVLCTARHTSCTFSSTPKPKRHAKKAADAKGHGDNSNANNSTANTNGVGTNQQPPAFPPAGAQQSLLSPSTTATTAASSASPSSNNAPGNNNNNNKKALLYVGPTSDQDPYILGYCTSNGATDYIPLQWHCDRVTDDPQQPIHFTIVPPSHLEARPHYYPSNKIEEIVHPYSDLFYDTYRNVINTAYPILLPSQLAAAQAYGPLAAAIYVAAFPFAKHQLRGIDHLSLCNFNHRALPIEARCPTLESIEAALIFHQRHSITIRSPPPPGSWSDTLSLIGMCHEVGLHVDPTDWRIPVGQKRRRTRLWWAVYIHEKWSALGLGRPSLLSQNQHNVPMITEQDFLEDDGTQSLPHVSVSMFIGMVHLTKLLSDILETFYSISAIEQSRSHNEEQMKQQVTNASKIQEQLDAWCLQTLLSFHNTDLSPDPTGTIFLSYYTVQLVLYRAMFQKTFADGSEATRDKVRNTLNQVTNLLRTARPNRQDAFWWSYSKMNFGIAGAMMIRLLYMSMEKKDNEGITYWKNQIQEFRSLLRRKLNPMDTTRSASVRMDLLWGIFHQRQKKEQRQKNTPKEEGSPGIGNIDGFTPQASSVNVTPADSTSEALHDPDNFPLNFNTSFLGDTYQMLTRNGVVPQANISGGPSPSSRILGLEWLELDTPMPAMDEWFPELYSNNDIFNAHWQQHNGNGGGPTEFSPQFQTPQHPYHQPQHPQ